MSNRTLGWWLCALVATPVPAAAAPMIVENGRPNAEIVISPRPDRPRMVNLAALELQHYLERISGSRLPIVTEPGAAGLPVRIFVGRSEHADLLGASDEGLRFGAFRTIAGADHLVLAGHDFDYAPPEPWARSNSDRPRAQADWDLVVGDQSGTAWGYPFHGAYKEWWNPRDHDALMAARYGVDNRSVWNPRDLGWSRDYQGPGGGAGFWVQDEGGSLNAVYAFLRSLGVRWYMPGEIGEVIPARSSITLPDASETERPDSELRAWFWYNFSMFPFEHLMWARRLGMNSGWESLGNIGHAHGLVLVHGRREMQDAHPEYYALRGDGTRITDFRGGGHACFSSDGLFREAVAFARFVFDHYGEPHVSLWPMDGYQHCQCEGCRDHSPSDLVWGFVDRVARELYRSHPDRIVSCGAYTPYIYPPKTVEKFTPNVVVFIANAGRPLMDDPARWKAYQDRLAGWREKMAPGNIMRVENNRYGLERSFPVIHPRNMAADLQALKGISRGEYCEVAQAGGRWHSPGIDHLTLYVQAAYLWDVDRDLDALLDEYYTLFYGPAGEGMRAAFEFAERSYSRTDTSRPGGRTDPRNVPLSVRVELGELLLAAREQAGDTVYGRRIQAVQDELPPLDELRRQLAEQAAAGDPRAGAPIVEARHATSGDDTPTYTFSPVFPARLRETSPRLPTTFSVTWERKALCFDIRCAEPDMPGLNVNEDVWDGDSVQLLLEPPGHSYYHVEVNPAGAVFDADRAGAGQVTGRWESLAEIETERGDDYWRVRVRIPVAIVGEEGAEGDPFNYVTAPELHPNSTWYFNLGRRRVRGRETIISVFSPTGERGIHVPEKFAGILFR